MIKRRSIIRLYQVVLLHTPKKKRGKSPHVLLLLLWPNSQGGDEREQNGPRTQGDKVSKRAQGEKSIRATKRRLR